MSPDDIFAAQFWPWPDPAIKRDPQGRVLFVNAAFLQLYGGTVAAWTGNIVGGWPAPQAPGQPYRFETRIPASAEQGEQVYDWIEMSLADGNAFALARNVTVFIQPASPQPAATMPVQTSNDQIQNQAPAQQFVADNAAMPAQGAQEQFAPVSDHQAVQPDTQFQAAPSQTVPAQAAPSHTAPAQAVPTFETPNASAQDASHQGMQPAYEEQNYAPQTAPHIPDVTFESGIETPDIPIPDMPAIAESHDRAPNMTPQEDNAAPERAYERRALPIENESAVLGNNWRDAVIAKAIGADMPAADVEPNTDATPAESSDEDGVGSKRILLAEDNAINALLTRTLLEADGHTVETVQDGQLAVEAMKTAAYDLIFMDMRMPNMDGLEATRKIRTMSNVSKDLPIIALTANAFDDDRNACFDSGMNDFMTKPVSAEELSEMVEQWTKPKEDRMAG